MSKMKVDYQINQRVGAFMIIFSIFAFFADFFFFEIFGKKIDYLRDLLPISLGFIFLGFGFSTFYAIFAGKDAGMKAFLYFIGGFFIIYLLGFLLNG
ncbi:hypothetical protein HN784_03270 [bacterium]|jgi:hypothetical protein|nr:hypothetical protein [bacterium]MBT4251315.1 hypothetical protein [bacterium]MBT4598304.1 hypothetical protein [bacterium]MBT6754137.1 hypothetical protein [bacterium]MBT7037957.1 hypothetical protein [bacterium]